MKKCKFLIIIFISVFYLNAECQNWVQWGSGSDSYEVSTFFVDTSSNALYVAGGFVSSTGDSIKGIARWDTVGWGSIGTGITHYGITTITKYNGAIYAAGYFGYPSENIQKFDGTNWIPVGSGVDNAIKGLAVYNNELYAVGFFGTAGGVNANKIAKWNDSIWSSISTVWALSDPRVALVYKNELYIGGAWDSDPSELNIIRWDGSYWKPAENGISNSGVCDIQMGGVFDLAIYNNELYVAGCFWLGTGSVNMDNCIERWDGNTWHSMGGGLNGQVYKLQVYNNELYACGEFTEAGGIAVDGIAKWNGSEWCSLGSDFYGKIYSMTVYNNEFIIGGSFTQIDGHPINHIAKWVGGTYVDTCGHLNIGINEFANDNLQFKISPNPSTNQITIEFESQPNASIEIKNVLGETVKTIANAAFLKGTNKIEIDMHEFSSGLYFVQIKSENKILSKKFVKQ